MVESIRFTRRDEPYNHHDCTVWRIEWTDPDGTPAWTELRFCKLEEHQPWKLDGAAVLLAAWVPQKRWGQDSVAVAYFLAEGWDKVKAYVGIRSQWTDFAAGNVVEAWVPLRASVTSPSQGLVSIRLASRPSRAIPAVWMRCTARSWMMYWTPGSWPEEIDERF